MNIFILLLCIITLWYFLIVRNGNLSFWQLVAKYPSVALGFFLKNEEAWFVDAGSLDQDKSILKIGEWDGPFQLMMPNMNNKMMKVFGKVGKYEESQKEFINLVKNKT